MITSSHLINETAFLEVRISPVKSISSLLSCAALVAGGILLVLVGGLERVIWGWITILFFGLCMVFAIREILDGRPRAVIDYSGIQISGLTDKILWEDIRGAFLKGSRRGRDDFLCLNLNNKEKYLDRLSGLRKTMARFNEKKGYTFAINLRNTNIDAREILEFIRKRVRG